MRSKRMTLVAAVAGAAAAIGLAGLGAHPIAGGQRPAPIVVADQGIGPQGSPTP